MTEHGGDACTLAGRDDQLLRTRSDRVSGCVDALDRAPPRPVHDEVSVRVARDVESGEEFDTGRPLRTDESALDGHQCPVVETDAGQRPAVTLEVRDAASVHEDPGGREFRLFDRVDHVGAVRENRQPIRPAGDQARAVGKVGSLADERQGAISQLPCVARRAGEERHAVEGADARNRGKGLPQTCGHHDGIGPHGCRRPASLQCQGESGCVVAACLR